MPHAEKPQTFQQRKTVTLQVLEKMSELAKTNNMPEQSAGLLREKDHLSTGELNVTVCGEAKRGKSTFINAFLEEEELCPSDAPVATNAVTVVRYGENERILVHLLDDKGVAEKKEISRAEIKKYVTEQGNERNRQQVKLLEIWLPNTRLFDGLVLMDTPGVGSLNPEHTAATYAIIPYSDASLFIGSANEPLSQPELDFCERVAKHCPQFFHVLTKLDVVENAEKILGDNLLKLRTALKRDIKGIAVSSRLKIESLKDGDVELLEDSNFPAFERSMWALLQSRSDILIEHAALLVFNTAAQISLPLQAELDVLKSKSPREIEELKRNLEEKVERASQLAQDPTLWINTLNREFRLIRHSLSTLLDDEFGDIEKRLDNYVEVKAYAQEPKKVAALLTFDCNNAFAAISQELEVKIGVVLAKLRETTRLDLQHPDSAKTDTLAALKFAEFAVRPDATGMTKVSNVARSTTMTSGSFGMVGAFTGGVIGAILGSLALPGLGTVGGANAGATLGGAVGTFIGAIFGAKRGVEELHEKDRASLRASSGLFLSKIRTQIASSLDLFLDGASSEVRELLLREIRTEQDVCKKAIGILAAASSQKQSEKAARELQLSNDLKMLNTYVSTMLTLCGMEVPTPAAPNTETVGV